MTRRSSFSGDTLVLSPMLLLAGAVDRSFYADAACRMPGTDTPKQAWTAELKRKYPIGGEVYSGHKLITLACMICKGCPVQWDCARAAIEAYEPIGTWSDRIENIHWLAKRPDWEQVIDRAEAQGTPVQVAIKATRRGM